MIKFIDISDEAPYVEFQKLYDQAKSKNQSMINAVSISSLNIINNEVSSRFVNLKFIQDKSFIFFTNYRSPKANDFKNHNQISALFLWDKINTQVRIKANIHKSSREFNLDYFRTRSLKKNALAISSMQSQKINSFESIKKNYQHALNNENLSLCPEYWGGFYFIPYEFEFWHGNEHRLNKRNFYRKVEATWDYAILEP